MEYAQLNEAGTEALQITTHGNVEWDANNYCSAEALTRDGKAEQFRVVPLTVTEPPECNPITQQVVRNGCQKINGIWEYKWDIIEKFDTQDERDRAILSYNTVPLLIPGVVTMRQARLALLSIGILSQVDDAIVNAGPEAKIEWEYAQAVQRNSALVSKISNVLNMNEQQVDDLFVLASTM